MDKTKAGVLFDALKGKSIDGYEVSELINNGKSAAVFLGIRGEEKVAIKVFDKEIIEQYGDKTQIARIEREITLKGINHPNLVSIISGGVDQNTNSHYLIMEYLTGNNLADCLQKIPAENVPQLIEQLAKACEFLESRNLAHRDVKPENIQVSEDLSSLKLLDFGVIRPIGEPGLTDDGNILPFIGTLQYSSPEFLLREEEDSIKGWRAVTFYQIGAVIHDLIMRSPIFENFSHPYVRLANAVQNDIPIISSQLYEKSLQDLGMYCLSKDPKVRLKLVKWSDFFVKSNDSNSVEHIRSRILKRQIFSKALHNSEKPNQDNEKTILFDAIENVKSVIRSLSGIESVLLPPVRLSMCSDSKNTIIMKYGPDQTHSLNSELRLALIVSIVDWEIGAISIFGKNLDIEQEASKVHSGSRTVETIQPSIEKFILTQIDNAQETF